MDFIHEKTKPTLHKTTAGSFHKDSRRTTRNIWKTTQALQPAFNKWTVMTGARNLNGKKNSDGVKGTTEKKNTIPGGNSYRNVERVKQRYQGPENGSEI